MFVGSSPAVSIRETRHWPGRLGSDSVQRASGQGPRPTGTLDRERAGTGEGDGAGAASAEPRSPPAARGLSEALALSPEELELVQRLEARDREVRSHEAAHVAAAGGLAGAPSYTFQTGPDGRQYAVGGSVSIDTSPGRTPQETLSKARRIRAAATAPANPSAQDLAVAASATRMEAVAMLALRIRTPEDAAVVRSPGDAEEPGRSSAGRSTETRSTPMTEDSSSGARIALLMAGAGTNHSHMKTDCGFCAKVVASYGR